MVVHHLTAGPDLNLQKLVRDKFGIRLVLRVEPGSSVQILSSVFSWMRSC